MQNYLNKNIYKVSNPPGGYTSIKLGWDQPQQLSINNNKHNKNNNKLNNNNRLNMNKDRNYPLQYENNQMINNNNKSSIINSNRSMIYQNNNKPIPFQTQRNVNLNMSHIQSNQYNNNHQYNHHNNFNQYNHNNHNYDKQNHNYNYDKLNNNNNYDKLNHYQQHYPILNHNISTPYSFNKKSYMKYMNPNFIQPRNNNNIVDNELSIQNWEQSSRLLQDQLKYYKQKNRLLKQKIYGGYDNDQSIKKLQDIHKNQIKKISTYNHPQQLQLAIQQRQKNINFQHQRGNNRNNSINQLMYQNINSLLNGSNINNGSMLLQNQSTVKTSVKVHNPPGGYSSIKFG